MTLLALVGVISGAANAIAGGGSLIVFPALLAVGLPPLDANVTNSIAQWPSYFGATVGQRADLQGQAARLRLVVPLAAAGAFTGAVLLLVLSSAVFDTVVPVLVLAASALMALQPRITHWTGDPQPGDPDRTVALGLSVFVATLYGGYFGGALGIIMMALLAVTANDTLRRLNAVKVALSMVAATAALAVFALGAPVHWGWVAVIGPATLVGGYAGAKIAQRMHAAVLRWSVVVLGVAVGAYLVVT